jgi:hypothetical protein
VLRSGSHLGRITFRADLGRFRLSQTLGFSAYEGRDYGSPTPVGARDTTTWPPAATTVPYFSRVSFGTFRGVIESVAPTANRWTLGYELSAYRASSIAPRHAYSWSNLSPTAFQVAHTLPLASIWGERVVQLNSTVALEAGLRVESSRDKLGPRLAPSLMARSRIGTMTYASAGYSRTFQDIQELPFTGSFGFTRGRGFWIISGQGVPAIAADQLSIGLERWLGGSVLLDANSYARHLSHVATRPLPAGDTLPRPLFQESTINAYGLELGARKLTGRLTGSLGYSYGKARQRIGTEGFTAPGDRTHAFDATAMLTLGWLRLGYAETIMTGAPYTRMNIGYGEFAGDDAIHWTELSTADARNAQRLPDYLSADAFAEIDARILGVGFTSFFGVSNVTDHENFTIYSPASAVGLSKGLATWYTDGLYSQSNRAVRLGFRLVF